VYTYFGFRGYGDSHGDSIGDSCGYGMGMGLKCHPHGSPAGRPRDLLPWSIDYLGNSTMPDNNSFQILLSTVGIAGIVFHVSRSAKRPKPLEGVAAGKHC